MGRGKYTYEFVKETVEKDGNKLLSKEYKNGKTPMDIKCGKCGVEYQIRFQAFLKGTGCKKCADDERGRKKRTPDDVVKAMVESKDGTFIRTFCVNGRLRVEYKCNKCDKIFKMVYFNYKRKQHCKCSPPKITIDYDYINNYVKDAGETLVSKNWENPRDKLKIKCSKCDQIYTTIWRIYYKRGVRCGLCESTAKKTYKDAKNLIENGGDSLVSKKYKNCVTKMEIKCGTCKEHFWMTYSAYRQGDRCPKCALDIKIKNMTHSQEFVASYLAEYGDTLCSEYINMESKIEIKCGRCNVIFKTSFSNYKTVGVRCPCNTMSRGERAIKHYCDTKSIKYEMQKTFEGCKNKIALRFDFYLPDYDLLIEYDGRNHFVEVDLFGGKDYLDYRRENDIIKNIFCYDNGKNLLRIPYTDYKNVDQLLDKYITEDFDRSIIYTDVVVYKDLINDCKWFMEGMKY